MSFTNEIQKKVLGEFKGKKFNILISTSVTEEGFDVPRCNLVIAFDNILSLKSFIQMKGRARAKKSEFFVMAPEILVIKKNIKN